MVRVRHQKLWNAISFVLTFGCVLSGHVFQEARTEEE
jgi:hypothetical protein